MGNRRRPGPDAPGGALGDVLDELRVEGHLTARQYRAGTMLLDDLQARHGTSAGIVGRLAERVDTSIRPPLWPSGAPGGGSLAPLDARLKRLHGHERRLMALLFRLRELPRGNLSDLGRQMSGYRTARTARAVMVGRIGALLDSLADEYLGPEDLTLHDK